MPFNEKLTKLLKTNADFLDEDGGLVPAAVQDFAWRGDAKLLALLLQDGAIKEKFFAETGGHWIFNTALFVDYISQKNFLDDSYTRFRNRIGLAAGDKYLSELGNVSLAWPYKDCVLEGGQTKEEDRRREIFFNEILAEDEITRLLAPKVMGGFSRHSAVKKSEVADFARGEDGVICENMVIQGNNLLALHTIKEQFRGKIKLIYIDPPYNTGGDANIFTYNNNFNHSAWLVFMKNRLEVARELLTEDGFIAIAIDHNELFYVGVLADEIFGRKNRLGVVSIVIKAEGRQFSKFFSVSNEYMMVYALNKGAAKFYDVILSGEVKPKFNLVDEQGRYKLRKYINYNKVDISGPNVKPDCWYPFYVNKDLTDLSLEPKDGYTEILPIDGDIEKTWQTQKQTALVRLNAGELVCEKNDKGELEIFLKDRENQRYLTHWADKSHNTTRHGTNLLKKLVKEHDFSYPKSLYAVMDTLKIMMDKNDMVLDFFAGSGTTAHAVLELNKEDGGDRKFILVEQLGDHAEICQKRIKKVMELNKSKASFISCELLKYNEIFMDKIQAAKSGKELMNIWKDMAENSFLKWYVNHEIPADAGRDFAEIGKRGLETQKQFLAELLDKNQLYVHLSEMDDSRFKVGAKDKALNKKFHGDGNAGR